MSATHPTVHNDSNRQAIGHLQEHLNRQIVGQSKFIEQLLTALLADGHVLIEGAPGLAKTKAAKTLSEVVECDEQRIQFTPDLLPSDLTGTEVYRPENATFEFQRGPLFHSLILADEINRAPAKVQSALLEAMAEHQVTVGGKTYPLPKLFMVMATQNPIEQEGTYPLPEAQLDRFLMHVKIDYPQQDAEREILNIVRGEAMGTTSAQAPTVPQEVVFECRQQALNTFLSPALEEYILQLVLATRDPSAYGDDLREMIAYGASPRGTIALDRCARVNAWLRGSDFASPADVQAVIKEVLRHRIILTFEAEADGVTKDHFIDELIKRVPVS